MPKIGIGGTGNIDNIQMDEQASTPSTPGAGKSAIYLKADGLYVIDDAGGVTGPMVSSAGGSIGTLTDWTPTVTQSGSVSATVSYAKYVTLGASLYWIFAALAITGSGTGANDIVIGNLPATPAYGGVFGTGWMYDANPNVNYSGVALYIAGPPAGFRIRCHLETDDIGSDPNIALASGDIIHLVATYPT